MNKHILFVIIFFFLSCSNIFGIDYLYDDFTSKDESKWNFYPNGGTIEIVDNSLSLSSTALSFPYLISKNSNLFTVENNSVLSIKFKYNNNGYMGTGISVGFTGDNGSFFDQFQIWRDIPHGLFFAYTGFDNSTDFCNTSVSVGRTYVSLNLDNNWHILKIERKDTKYNVYIDPEINNQPIFISQNNQCIPKNILIGNVYTGGRNDWNNLSIDNINVGVTVPVIKPKVIVIPGFGASWNSEAIVYNKTVGNDQWKMTPFVKTYDGLINGLKENGLKENEDFYVWNYDWRRPLVDIVANLNTFINQKIKTNEKVTLVGHSLGGLTARIWAEDNKDDSRLTKVVTLGSPHLGVVETYEIWNGGQISDLSKISSIAFKILLKIQGLTTKSDMEAARKYAPLVKDLLPTFDFVKKNGVNLSNNKLETKNTFLKNKNEISSNLGTKLKLFSGTSVKTMNSIDLTNNGIFDKVLGIWPDGRIKNSLYTNNGDSTVLTKSANYKGENFTEINSNHGDIVNETVNQVMTEIGLSQVDIVSQNQDFTNSVVVFIGSPVTYSVKCDNDSPVLENDGFVIIKNKDYKDCNINFIGTGNGLIHVVAGNTNDNNWSYWEKNVVAGEIGSVKINPKNGQIINDKDNILFLKSMIKADIESLLVLNKNNNDLKEALKYLDKNQSRLLIKSIFNFRLKNNERVVSQKIIENSTIWMSLINTCPKNLATNGFKKVDGYQNIINFLVGLNNKKNSNSEYVAMSYQKMDNLLKINKNKIDKKDYSNVCANNFVALNYGTEVLIKNYDLNWSKKWLLQDSDL